jgi:hypothetical protein
LAKNLKVGVLEALQAIVNTTESQLSDLHRSVLTISESLDHLWQILQHERENYEKVKVELNLMIEDVTDFKKSNGIDESVNSRRKSGSYNKGEKFLIGIFGKSEEKYELLKQQLHEKKLYCGATLAQYRKSYDAFVEMYTTSKCQLVELCQEVRNIELRKGEAIKTSFQQFVVDESR